LALADFLQVVAVVVLAEHQARQAREVQEQMVLRQ
jgi:hypothetical protein